MFHRQVDGMNNIHHGRAIINGDVNLVLNRTIRQVFVQQGKQFEGDLQNSISVLSLRTGHISFGNQAWVLFQLVFPRAKTHPALD